MREGQKQPRWNIEKDKYRVVQFEAGTKRVPVMRRHTKTPMTVDIHCYRPLINYYEAASVDTYIADLNHPTINARLINKPP